MLGGEAGAGAGGVDTEHVGLDLRLGCADEAGALNIIDPAVRKARLEAIEHGHRLARRAVIVADQGIEAVGIGPDHRDPPRCALEGEQIAFVLEQHHRGSGHLQRLVAMRRGVEIGLGDVRPRQRGIVVEHAEPHPRSEQADKRAVEHLDRQRARVHAGNDLVGLGTEIVAVIAADHVHSGLEAERDALHAVLLIGKGVLAIDVRRAAAVGDDIALEAPVAPQPFLHQERAGAGGDAVERVVGAHDRPGLGLGHRLAEGGEVGFLQILRRGGEVLLVAAPFGPGMDGIVLRGRDGLVVFGIVALQPLDEGDPGLAREVRVLAIGLLPAAPARIAEDVDVGGPDGETLVEAAAAVGLERVEILRAELGGDDRRRVLHAVGIPHGRHADRLREHGGDAGAGDAVQPLVPPIVGGHAEAGDRGGGMAGLPGLLLQRHRRDQRLGSSVEVERRVAPGRRRCRRWRGCSGDVLRLGRCGAAAGQRRQDEVEGSGDKGGAMRHGAVPLCSRGLTRAPVCLPDTVPWRGKTVKR